MYERIGNGLTRIFLAGVGALAMTAEKSKEVVDELVKKLTVEQGKILHEELKREAAKVKEDVVYVTYPKVKKHLTTSRILVMEYIEGIPIDHRDELLELDYDLWEISEKLAENYVKQMLDDGFFHADPYRGNLCVKDGKIV